VQEAAIDRGYGVDQFGECKGRFQGESPFPFCGESETVEDRDGIGGVMAWTRARQAAGGRLRGTQEKAVNPSRVMLNAEAHKKVGENRTKIVNALYDSLIKGNASSGKLLFALADGLINCEDPVAMNQLCSYVRKLELEKQLTADAIDEEAEAKLDEIAS